MTMLNYHHHGGRKSKRKLKSRDNPGMRLTALFLCLSMLAGLLPMMVQAADAGEKLSVYEQSTPSDEKTNGRKGKYREKQGKCPLICQNSDKKRRKDGLPQHNPRKTQKPKSQAA